MMTVERQIAALRSELQAAIDRVIDEQAFSGGPAVLRFEKTLSQLLEGTDVICVNSGTTALHAALIALGVGPDDEVITTPFTWISTAWAISYVGARPVFCDVEASTGNLDVARLDTMINARTRAVIPVHLYGNPVNLDDLRLVCERRGVAIVEDCAHSIGATWRGRATGTFGAVNATSFYPGKNLGAWGEGGAVLTRDPVVAERLRILRDHAQVAKHHHVEMGYNWRMDGIQGAVLEVKLRHLARANERRRAIAAHYHEMLGTLPGVRVLGIRPEANPVWHVYPVFHTRRDDFRERLKRRGVNTGVHYPVPIHLQPAYSHLAHKAGDFVVAERLAAEELSLPMFPELTDAEVERVITAVKETARELGRGQDE